MFDSLRLINPDHRRCGCCVVSFLQFLSECHVTQRLRSLIQRGIFDSTVGTDVYLSGVFFTDTSVCGSFKQQISFTKLFLHHNG